MLGLLLEHHPALLSVDEVMRQIAGEPAEPEDRVVFNTAAVSESLATPAMLAVTDYVERFAESQRAKRAAIQGLPDQRRRLLEWTG